MPKIINKVVFTSGETRTWEHEEGEAGVYRATREPYGLRLVQVGPRSGEIYDDLHPWHTVVKHSIHRTPSKPKRRQP